MHFPLIHVRFIHIEALEDDHNSSNDILNFKIAVDQVSEKVQQEIKALCSKETNSILLGKTEEEPRFHGQKCQRNSRNMHQHFGSFLRNVLIIPDRKQLMYKRQKKQSYQV